MIKKIFIVSTSMLFLLTACNFPLFTPGVDQNAVNTSVAQTLAAAGGVVEPPGEISATNTVGSEPVNTVEVVNPPTATVTATATVTLTPIPCNLATFVADVTIEDGTEIEPGTAFTKTWRIRNVGSCTWTSGYSLIFDHGDQMGGPASIQLTGSSIPPGGEVDVSVDLVVPAAEGEYKGYWKFRESGGAIFALTTGNPVSVEIVSKTGSIALPAVPLLPFLPLLPIFLTPYTDMVWQQASVAAGSTGSVKAECPSGSIVVGGGFAASNNFVVYTTLMDGNGWLTYAKNNSGSNNLLNSYAVCLHNSGGSVSQVVNQVTVEAGTWGHAVATCPAGSIPTGGGWASNLTFRVYHSSATPNGWEVYAENNAASSKLLNAYVVCLSGTGGTVQETQTSFNITAGSSSGENAPCPADTMVTGGGFAMQDDLIIYNTTPNTDNDRWASYARNTGGETRLMFVYVTCLTIP